MSRLLNVSIEHALVGTLYENSGVWSFQYDQGWLAHGFPLAPGLPVQPEMIVDSGTSRPVQWFFDNLLPEEAARSRLIASLEKGEWDAWALLERFGAESAGALTLLPPGAHLSAPGLNPLQDQELERRISAMPYISLGSTAPKKMSLAGAQEKLPVFVRDGQLYEPVGTHVSTHILKPDVLSEHYPASAVNEWFCARMAQEVGMNVPQVELRYVPSPVYLIHRFDREIVNNQIKRRHTLDAAQLLSLSAGSKYSMSGARALRDVVSMVRAKAATRIEIFRWVVFNVLIGNGDAHLKNLSLFAGREGYALAPFYDLVSTAAWATPQQSGQPAWPDIDLSFLIGTAKRFGEIERENFFELAEEIALPRAVAEKEIDKLTFRIIPAADRVMEELKVMRVPDEVRASQINMLRAIRYLPVTDMVRKLIPSHSK